MIDQLDDLGVWTVETPPADFADRVLADAREESTPEPRPRRWGWMIAASAAAALFAVAALMLVARGPADSHGTVETAERRTVEIPGRAIVVSEPGTALRWTAEDDQTRVVQRRGSAFYRVEDGNDFEIVTPAGYVRVTGTCFTVEINDMHTDKNRGLIKGLALGAALTAAVVVTVYEGEVVLANDKGDLTVPAGQRAIAGKGHAPRMTDDAEPAPSDATTVAALRAQNRANQRELRKLREEIAQRDSGPAPEASASEETSDALASPFAITSMPGFSYFEPTPDMLEKMADCGVVAWDQPPVWDGADGFGDAWSEAAELGEGERAQVDAAFGEFQEQSVAKLRSFYEETGGDPDAASKFSAPELLQLLYTRLDREEMVATREAIARERAGREAPPDEQSVVGRFMRWEASLGNAFEHDLGERIGSDRARELRVAADGWGGKRLTFTNLCADD